MKLIRVLLLGVLLAPLTIIQAGAQAALPSIVLEPSSLDPKKDTELTVTVSARTGGQSVNAVEFIIKYTTDTLRFNSFASDLSAFEIEAPGAGDNSGTITMARASIDPKNSGNAVITNLSFTVIADGPVTVSVSDTSKLLNASSSQNILGSTFTFTASGNGPSSGSNGSIDDAVNETALTGEPIGPGDESVRETGSQLENTGEQVAGSDLNAITESQASGGATSATGSSVIDSDGKQWIVAGITGLGVLLVIAGYGYVRFSKKKGGLPTEPVIQNGGELVTPIMPDASLRDQNVNHAQVDALLGEVHGAEVKSAEISPKRINL